MVVVSSSSSFFLYQARLAYLASEAVCRVVKMERLALHRAALMPKYIQDRRSCHVGSKLCMYVLSRADR
jgi:hypothetical protein